jgi:hypothetical protein
MYPKMERKLSESQKIERTRAEALFKKEKQMREGARAMANTKRREKRPGRRQLGSVHYDLREMLLNRPKFRVLRKPVRA